MSRRVWRNPLNGVAESMRAILSDLDVIDRYAAPEPDSGLHEQWLMQETSNQRWSRQKAANIADRLTTIRYLLYQLRHEVAALEKTIRRTVETAEDHQRTPR